MPDLYLVPEDQRPVVIEASACPSGFGEVEDLAERFGVIHGIRGERDDYRGRMTRIEQVLRLARQGRRQAYGVENGTTSAKESRGSEH